MQFGEGKLMATPTNRPGEYGAICLFEGLKIEGRDLQKGVKFPGNIAEVPF